MKLLNPHPLMSSQPGAGAGGPLHGTPEPGYVNDQHGRPEHDHDNAKPDAGASGPHGSPDHVHNDNEHDFDHAGHPDVHAEHVDHDHDHDGHPDHDAVDHPDHSH